jgi:hypothetical protein
MVLPLGSRALDILVYLVNRPGEVVKKKKLFDYVWPDVLVEEGTSAFTCSPSAKRSGTANSATDTSQTSIEEATRSSEPLSVSKITRFHARRV